jgi:hypothetical protein
MTPMEIEMLICVHCSKTPEANMPLQRWNSPVGKCFQERIKMLGLATFDGAEWHGTDRLAAYIDHLCSQPLPVQTWVIPSLTEASE